MTPDLVWKYAAPVPRYTSYPTAPHFHAGVGAAHAARWLGELPAEARLSLYLHVPFCRVLCWFCGCHTAVANKDPPIERYFALALREIEMVAGLAGRGRRLVHIHLGGGSPSLLRPDQLTRLAAALHRNFTIDAGAEFAIEIDPRNMDAARVAALAAIGVNRASLGVQDFDPDVQRAINRVQPEALTARVVDDLRAHGVARINLDLMYGLPRQTLAGVAATAERALALAPDRLALFGYAHVPWMKRHQRLIDTAALPDPWQRWCQTRAAARSFEAAGYRAIGLDHFARPGDPLTKALEAGTLRRNFQGYTADPADALIAIGASSIGAFPGGYVQNHGDLRTYGAAIAAGRPAATRGIALTAEDRLRAAAIERLMTTLTLDTGALCRAKGFAESALDAAVQGAEALAADGLCAVAGRRVTIPADARSMMRTVAACFDAYLTPVAATRHSLAV